jgi:hypothetical protein
LTRPFTNAARQKRFRQRQRQQIRMVSVEISEDDIIQLINEGHLTDEQSDDPRKIADAVRTKLDVFNNVCYTGLNGR